MRISFQNELLTASYHSSAARKRNEILGFWSASTLPTTLLTLVDTRSRFCLVLLPLTRLFCVLVPHDAPKVCNRA